MLNEILKELRKEKNKSQGQLADYFGIPRTTYANYEQGVREPNISFLKKIAEYYGVTVSYLLEDPDDKNNSEQNRQGFARFIEDVLIEKGMINEVEPTDPQELEKEKKVFEALKTSIEALALLHRT